MLLGCRIAYRKLRQHPSSGRWQDTRLDEPSQPNSLPHRPQVGQLRRRYGITGAWYPHYLGSLVATDKFFSSRAAFLLKTNRSGGP